MNWKIEKTKSVPYYIGCVLCMSLAYCSINNKVEYYLKINGDSGSLVWSNDLTVVVLFLVGIILFLIGNIKNREKVVINYVHIVLILIVLLINACYMDWGRKIDRSIWLLWFTVPFCLISALVIVLTKKIKWPRITLIIYSSIGVLASLLTLFSIIQFFPSDYKKCNVLYIQQGNSNHKIVLLTKDNGSIYKDYPLGMVVNSIVGKYYWSEKLNYKSTPEGNWYKLDEQGDSISLVELRSNRVVFSRIIPKKGNTSSSTVSEIQKNVDQQKKGKLLIQNAKYISLNELTFRDKVNLDVEVIDDNNKVQIDNCITIVNCDSICFKNLDFVTFRGGDNGPLINISSCKTVIFTKCHFSGNRNILVQSDSLCKSIRFIDCLFEEYADFGFLGYCNSEIKFNNDCKFIDQSKSEWDRRYHGILLKGYTKTNKDKEAFNIQMLSYFHTISDYMPLLNINDTINIDSVKYDFDADCLRSIFCAAVNKQMSNLFIEDGRFEYWEYSCFTSLAGMKFKQDLKNNEVWRTDSGEPYFLYVSPEYIKWFGDNMIPEPHDGIGNVMYSEVYKRIANPFRVLFETGLFLREKRNIEVEVEWYKQAAVDCNNQLFELVNKRYQFYPSCYGEVGRLDYEESMLNEDPYYLQGAKVENVLIYLAFWNRRYIDGSAYEIWNVLNNILEKYDKEWKDQIMRQYIDAGNENVISCEQPG